MLSLNASNYHKLDGNIIKNINNDLDPLLSQNLVKILEVSTQALYVLCILNEDARH